MIEVVAQHAIFAAFAAFSKTTLGGEIFIRGRGRYANASSTSDWLALVLFAGLPTSDEVEGATALPHIRLFFRELFLSISSFSLFPPLVCLLVSFGAAGFWFYFWVRGARIGMSASPPTPGS